MTRQEFADKWGYQSGVGYGCAQFDCRESLLKDLNVLIADEVKNLASCKHSDWTDLYYSSGDYYGRYCNDCGEFFE